MFFMFWAQVASGQVYTIHNGWLVQPEGFYSNGAGAPTVVYDSDQQIYVMLFETQLSGADEACPVGYWGIGGAISVNGLDWEVEPDPVIVPEAGTAHACVAAHPTAVLENGRLHVWFKAEQELGGSWGANRQTGVGYASGRVFLDGDVAGQLEQLLAERDLVIEQLNAAVDAYDNAPWQQEAAHYKRKTQKGTPVREALDAAFDQGKLLNTVARNSNANGGGNGIGFDPELALAEAYAWIDLLEDLQTEITPLLGDRDADDMYDANVEWIANTMLLIQQLEALLAELDQIEADIALLQKGIGGSTRVRLFPYDGPVLSVSGFGFPAVTKVGGTWTMLVAKNPDLYKATAPAPEGPWSMGGTPVMSPGVTSWTQQEIYNPAIVCEDTGSFPYTLFFGGRNFVDWLNIDLGGWGQALSGDASTWWISAVAYFEYSGNNSWRHWDAMRVGDDYLIWFSEKDGNGRNRIGLAHSTASTSWDRNQISDRICD